MTSKEKIEDSISASTHFSVERCVRTPIAIAVISSVHHTVWYSVLSSIRDSMSYSVYNSINNRLKRYEFRKRN